MKKTRSKRFKGWDKVKIDNNESMDKVKMSILKILEETDPANQMTRSWETDERQNFLFY